MKKVHRWVVVLLVIAFSSAFALASASPLEWTAQVTANVIPPPQFYDLTVHVQKRFRGNPIENVNITVYKDSFVVGSKLTDADGDAIFQVEEGIYLISASRRLFGSVVREKEQNVTVTEDTTVTFVFVCLRSIDWR